VRAAIFFLRDVEVRIGCANEATSERRDLVCGDFSEAACGGAAMTLRVAKTLLVLAVAGYYTLVVFDNLTDYDSNYQFVRHVLMMDSTFPGNHGMWRAMNSPGVHTTFYLTIIAWESLTMILCWWGGVRLGVAVRGGSAAFVRAKSVAILGLGVGMLMWMVAFLSVGEGWFLMWQSKTWNGNEAAFRMFTVIGVVLVFLSMPEQDAET
jgi:predicted small integral membrane protein